MKILSSLLLSFVVVTGCGDETPTTPSNDVSDTVDVTPDDTSPADTADDATLPLDDAAADDATLPDVDPPDEDIVADDTADDADDAGDVAVTLPLPGFGAISGTCDFIDDELTSATPSFDVNAIDFSDDPYDASDFDRLTAGGQEIIRDGNAGGNSLYSEVLAMEMLTRCELATLVATETEIVYDTEGKITDILVEIDGAYVGVSVVRAVGFPKDDPYTVEQATTILERKLTDIQASSANVSEDYRWVKQILFVVAYAEGHVASLETAWNGLSADTKSDTIVIVTVTHGDDAFLY